MVSRWCALHGHKWGGWRRSVAGFESRCRRTCSATRRLSVEEIIAPGGKWWLQPARRGTNLVLVRRTAAVERNRAAAYEALQRAQRAVS